MPVTPQTRVVAQADISSYPCAPWPYGVVNGNGQNSNTSFRALNPQDMSFIGNNPGSVSAHAWYGMDHSVIIKL